jgi:uncharacterized protein (DUF58 family)
VKPSLTFILALILAILLVGVATLRGSVLVLAIPLMAYLFAAIYARPEAIKLGVQREITQESSQQGAPIHVKLTLTNKGEALDELTVHDLIPAGARHVEGDTSATVALAAGGTLELDYTIAAVRGEYDRYDVAVSARDFLSFFEVSGSYRTNPHFLIHPRSPKLNRIKIRPPQTRGFAGPIAARQGGTGIDFWAVREYEAGDSQRQINWRLSARSERELFTNIFEQERVADVGIIVDARERTNITLGGDSLFEHSVDAAAALAQNFLDDGNRVSLLVYGSGVIRVFPGYGRIQRDRILNALAKAQPGVNFALESLTNLPTRFFPTQSQLVLISPLLPEDIPVILNMRARGYALMLVSPDPVSFESANGSVSSQPAYRLAAAERTLMLKQARQAGAQVVDWHVAQPLESTIREALARQPALLVNPRIGL